MSDAANPPAVLVPPVPPLQDRGLDGVQKHTTADMTQVKYPGKINIASERGVHGFFSGCACKAFDEGDGIALDAQLNRWAEENPFYNVVHIALAQGVCLVFYTRAITDEEIQDFMEVNQEVGRLMADRKAARAKAQEETEAKMKEAAAKLKQRADDEYKELKRLADLGRRHLANCKDAKDGKKGGKS